MTTRITISASFTVVAVWLLLWPAGSGFGRGAAVAPGRPHSRCLANTLRTGGAAIEALLPTSLQSSAAKAMAVAFSIGSAVVGGVMLSLAVVAAVVGFAWFERRRNMALNRHTLNEALPESIDLCTVVLGSGGTIRDCLEALAKHGPSPVRPMAFGALARADGSERLDQALRRLQLDLGPGFQPLTGALLLASEQGGSVGVLLARLAVEANASRRRLGELAARKLPVALLIPLVVCSLPAVVVGTVVPLALVALSDLDV